jgi:hypothetical protein
MPDPEDWIACWSGSPPQGWIDAVRSISVASLAMPVELGNDQLVAAYNDWLEGRILEPMRATEPVLYQLVVAHVLAFVHAANEESEGGETA